MGCLIFVATRLGVRIASENSLVGGSSRLLIAVGALAAFLGKLVKVRSELVTYTPEFGKPLLF